MVLPSRVYSERSCSPEVSILSVKGIWVRSKEGFLTGNPPADFIGPHFKSMVYLPFILKRIHRLECKLYNVICFFPTVTEHANHAKESLYELNIDKYDG